MTVSRRRVAVWLWVALAFVVWNVVFDQVIIDAGRHYIDIANASAESNGPYLNIEDVARNGLGWRSTAGGVRRLAAGPAYVVSAFRRTMCSPAKAGHYVMHYFSSTSSKNFSARGSFDCPSQNIAC